MSAWEELPQPGDENVTIRLTRQAERVLRKGHPWLFDQGIENQSHRGAPGDLTVIFDSKRKMLGLGLFDPSSPIRVKMLHSGKPRPIDDAFFAERIAQALARRSDLAATGTDGYRVLHGENDGLPGLVVDRYAGTLVVKLYSGIWVPRLRQVLPPLFEALGPERVVLRLSRRLQKQSEELFGLTEGQILHGPLLEGPVEFKENHLSFLADPIRGQKTGFFLDQRDNRSRVGDRASGKSVLNVFSYSGGFSLYAARGGARDVLSLDSSQPALDAAVQIFARNHGDPAVASCQHEILRADAFEGLAALAEQGRRFDLVVIDPPAFAKREAEIPAASKSYARLLRLGLQVLAPDSDLVFASCSSRISAELFEARMTEVAAQAGRPFQDLEVTGHAPDHPIGFAEGAYLKCLFARA